MSIDMELSDYWPESIHVEVQVHYAIGMPEHKYVWVEPCVSAHAVRVGSPRAGLDPLEMQRIGWVDLPGRSLYMRCLSVLALHWFGSIDMVPRVRGAPLWRSLSVEMTMPATDMNRLKFDIQVVNDASATLRYQFRRNQPLVSRTVLLDAVDADPLRALLRVGMVRIKPMAAPRKAVSLRSGRLSLHTDQNAHAPALQA